MKSLFGRMGTTFIAVAIAAFGFAGCKGAEGDSQTGKDGEKTKVITFAGWGSLAEKKIFTQMIAKYTDKYPNVKVNYQHVPGSQDDYMVKLSSNLAANNMPDIFYITTDDFSAWADADRLQNLDEYLSQSTEYTEGKVWDKSMKVFRYNNQTKVVGEDGSLYGLPKDLGPWAMVYNKTLFQQKGVALPDSSKAMTWDEYVAVAKQLTSGEGIDKVFGSSSYTLESAVWSNGADFLSEDKSKVTVDTSEFSQAMQWVADLANVHHAAPTPDEDAASGWFQRWTNGKVGMAWMGPWDQATFWDSVDFEWDLMPTPVSNTTGQGVTWLGSAALCVSPTSSYKEEAYKLAEFLSMNEEAQTYNYTSGQAVPNIIDMAKNEYFAMDNMPKNKQVFIDIIENEAKSNLKSSYYTREDSWLDYFFSDASKVWNGSMTAAAFCKEVQPKMQERLDKQLQAKG